MRFDSGSPRTALRAECLDRKVRRRDEILAHADELAARFEGYEPRDADELDAAAVAALRAAVQERSTAERHVAEAVRAARRAGLSWSVIGTFVGTSGEAVRQRYANKVA
jgi:hypothetical protein